jgi:hypothetical protein
VVPKFFLEHRPHNGLTYDDYVAAFNDTIASFDRRDMPDEMRQLHEYTRLNFQRTIRIGKQYAPSEAVRAAVQSIEQPHIWMVITEYWCGDSAQNLPYVAKVASVNPRIALRIILRDSNPDIMDYYLTDGSRSIPKLVGFDNDGNELFRWGPRPKAVQTLFVELRDAGITKLEMYQRLHAWYAKNGGEDIEKELIESINNLDLATSV